MGTEHTASCSNHTLMSCGKVAAADYPALLSRYAGALQCMRVSYCYLGG